MASQTQTFPCPFCGRRMGVGIELLGKHVRCPHCKQVVLAPASGAGAPAAAPQPVVLTPLPVPPIPEPAPQPKPAPPEPLPSRITAPPMPPAAVIPISVEPASPFSFQPPPPPVQPKPLPPPPPQPAPVAPDPLPLEQLPEEPVFTFPQREAADSILSEPTESEDEVFGSHPGTKLRVPEFPEPPSPAAFSPPAPPQPAADPFAFDHDRPVPAPVPPPPVHSPPPVPPQPPANPFADFESAPPARPPQPPAPRPVPAPVPPPPRPAPPQPAATGPANPWAALDAMAAPPAAPQPVLVPVPVNATPLPAPVSPLPVEEPEEKPARTPRTRPAAHAGQGGIPKGVVFGIAAYAVVMTVLAIYGLFIKSGEKLEPGHPLSTIPDNFGEFEPASRKKVTMYKFPVDGELPANQRAGLGGKIEVGQLVIEPVQIERRTVELVADGKGEKGRRLPSPGMVLALRLRVKNASDDLLIHPLDPAFTRKPVGDDKPATRIVIGQQSFAGGPFSWPFPAGTRQYDLEQAADATPLKPGETRDYVVLSNTQGALFQSLDKAKDAMLWRVEVRRGLIEFRGKERPVNAIIGVEFKKSEVRGL